MQPAVPTATNPSRIELYSFLVPLALLLVVSILVSLGLVRFHQWGFRFRNVGEASSLLPLVAAPALGLFLSLRIGWLVRTAERGTKFGGLGFAVPAFFSALVGLVAATFVLVCVLDGRLGYRAPAYSRAVDTLLICFLASAPLVLFQLLVLLVHGFRAKTWRVHLVAPLAWLAGAATLFGPGLAFMLG